MKRKGGWLFGLAVALTLMGAGRDAFEDWIGATVLPPLSVATSVEVRARGGELLRAYTVANGRWRLAADPARIDPRYIAMLLTYEDRRFYEHGGVDPWALARAGWQSLWAGRLVSGGSTLTMQLARLLEEGSTGEWGGKLRQMRLALALEKTLSKDQILSLYLLLAPFGGNLEGVRSASLAYFGKEPVRLTPAEAALLVALPQSPEARRPDRAPKRAEAARGRVLARAVTFDLIDGEEAEAASQEDIPLMRRDFPALAPHLADRARREAPLVGLHQLTIDRSLQQSLEELAKTSVQGRGGQLQTAIVVADHRSGEILASVGSVGFVDDGRQGFVDMTMALRSPGSTLKPLVYGLAFDQGLAHPETIVEDRPTLFGNYAPQNFDRQYRGEIRLREALQLSLNIPVVSLTDAFGPAKLVSAMGRAGMRYGLPKGQAGLAVALGGIGVSLQDMVQLYAALARGGVALPLRYRLEETTLNAQGGNRLISEVAAWQLGDILAGLAPPAGAPRNRLAYKTGTSYGHRDAWAIGYDGAHVIGVWMGRADGTPVPGSFGTDTAAPVLFQAFSRLKPELTPQPAAPAATLLLSNDQLPQPLRRFRPREAAFVAQDMPKVAFPPDGAEVELLQGSLKVRVQGGKAPFTWLVDGAPVLVAARDLEALLPLKGTGFVDISVIDAKGHAARARVRLR